MSFFRSFVVLGSVDQHRTIGFFEVFDFSDKLDLFMLVFNGDRAKMRVDPARRQWIFEFENLIAFVIFGA